MSIFEPNGATLLADSQPSEGSWFLSTLCIVMIGAAFLALWALGVLG